MAGLRERASGKVKRALVLFHAPKKQQCPPGLPG